MAKTLFFLLVYLVQCFAFDLLLNTLEFTNSKDPDDCDCVPYFLCKNRTIKTNGDGIMDIRFVLKLWMLPSLLRWSLVTYSKWEFNYTRFRLYFNFSVLREQTFLSDSLVDFQSWTAKILKKVNELINLDGTQMCLFYIYSSTRNNLNKYWVNKIHFCPYIIKSQPKSQSPMRVLSFQQIQVRLK